MKEEDEEGERDEEGEEEKIDGECQQLKKKKAPMNAVRPREGNKSVEKRAVSLEG